MQKKQSPVLLIVMGAVVLVGIGLTNSAPGFWARIFAPPPPKKDEKAAEMPKVDTKDMVMKSVAKGDAQKSMDPEEALKPTGIPEEPSIFQAKFKRYDPAPNETSTTSHWYDPNSQEQIRKEQLEKKRGS